MFKQLIQNKLESLVKKYLSAHPEIKLVVVSGSVGKTSTKLAIATVLSEKFRVRVHEGNFNDLISAPTAIMGIEYPKNIRNIFSWLRVFRQARKKINGPSDVDVIVQELGSDRIGQVPHFGKYLKPDIAVVTAVSAEHMEYFRTLDTVAEEELSVTDYSASSLINRDDIDGEYAKYLKNSNINTYGTNASAEYYFLVEKYTAKGGFEGAFVAPELSEPVHAKVHLVGEHILRTAIAAGAVGVKFGLTSAEIMNGMSKIKAISGRMNMLRGINGSTIIDDSYNSSPLAVHSSLRELYEITANQKIAVLGSMNELGETSQAEHQELGKLCDPDQLAWVVTVGEEAEKYLAPAAQARGCSVKSFTNSIDAGGFVRGIIENNSVILFKGSQGGVYLEEAIKVILHDSSDQSRLVRQSADWIKTKRNFFSKFKSDQNLSD